MSILYIECAMGAAGDMLTAALLELHCDPENFVVKFNSCGIPGVEMCIEKSVKCGISGTHVKMLLNGVVEHTHHHGDDHHHHHEHMNVHDIEHIVGHLNLSHDIKDDVLSVFNILAEAESKVHGTTIDHIHFHEIGTMDAVADIVAVCMLINELAPHEIYASPIHVGSGTVKCAHGILPVPAPATAEILKGIPCYSGDIKSELCTPTGAALLKYFVDKFTDEMPMMSIDEIGYGMGTKDFERPNCVRVISGAAKNSSDDVTELSCNIDDMTGEELGFAYEVLLKNGALDGWTTPIYMKKNRPAYMLSCLCKSEDAENFAKLIFVHTTTLGIRMNRVSRFCLDREIYTKDTEFGDVKFKKVSGWGVNREKPEYEDIAKIARERDLSIREIKDRI